MAYVVGVGLLVLVVVGIPLQYGAGKPAVVQLVGPVHGFLYIVYLLAVADLARRFRLSLGQVIALVAAGFVPLLAFVVERLTTRRIEKGGEFRAPRAVPAGDTGQGAR
jgi:integral membrane protein